MKQKDSSKLSPGEKKKIKDAENSYRKMWAKVKPFVKSRKVRQYSTRGQWKVSGDEP